MSEFSIYFYMKRKLEIAVLSDVHLGTHGCHSQELVRYLKSIDPGILVLNGDIIDIWQFNKKYFPKSHMLVINVLLKKALNGTKIYYLTGNHDDVLRKFSDFTTGSISLRNQLELHLNGEKHLFFHGDVFDASVMYSRWLAIIGGKGYDYLIRLNRIINRLRQHFGLANLSFAHQVKARVKKAVKYIQDFETLAINYGADRGVDAVICGHIHQPSMRKVNVRGRTINYLNSGDWLENLTALEYYGNAWHLYRYDELDYEFLDQNQPIEELFEPEYQEMEKRMQTNIPERVIRRLMNLTDEL